jgi:peptide/nickel transport system substrate-binding protein
MPKSSRYRQPVSRRRFLQVAGATGFTVAATARGGYAVAQTPAATGEFAQSPYLEGQDLPPVAERLPENPMVLDPIESIGKYGGLWRTGMIGGQDSTWMEKIVGSEYLVRWDAAWSEILPNAAESYEMSDDARSFTFTLRKGMKWSDGEPVTTEDVRFFAEDIEANEDLDPSTPTNPWTVEVVDEQTFTVTFEQANGLFLQETASPRGPGWLRYPAHYLKQFHKDYNTDTLDQLIADNKAADWVELFQMMGMQVPGTPTNAQWLNPDLPRLHAWKLDVPYGESTQVTFSRNPYYWKVDTEGNQLPYVDEVRFEVFQDNEVLLLRASNGEIDFHARHITTNTNKPVLAENREKGDYDFFDLTQSLMNTAVFSLNQVHKNEAMREVFANRDFRLGLSHAINRQEIIDVVYVGQGEPWHLAPRVETPFYNETLAKLGTEFDIDQANELLDGVLPDKGGNGMRLLPSGEELIVIIEVSGDTDPAFVDTANMVSTYWNAVGVNSQVKAEDRSLLYSRKEANEHDCVVWQGDGGLNDAMLDPRWYIPFQEEANYGVPWAYWYQGLAGTDAEPVEPPEDVKAALALYDDLKATGDPAAQNEIMAQILAAAEELFVAIGISLPGPGYGIRKNYVRNVPDVTFNAYLYPTPNPTNPCTYWFDV